MELVINNLPKKKKSTGPDGFIGDFCQIYQLPAIFFQKIEAKGKVPNSFYTVNIILIPKPDKDIYRKGKLQTNTCYQHKCKNPKEY